jgi:hypothetical protein
MIRRGRAEREIDPAWLARAVALTSDTYPQIPITEKVVASLLEHFTAVWRRSGTAREAVAQTCRVGRQIVPSAATAIVEPRALPPLGAKPGQAFGADKIRHPLDAQRLLDRAERLDDKARKAIEQQQLVCARIAVSRSRTKRDELGAKSARLEDTLEDLRSEALALREQARALERPAVDPWRQVRPQKPRRTAQGATCPPDQAACSLGLLGGLCGLPAPLVLASHRGAPVPRSARFCLTSADRLIPSHDARRGFAVRADYPPQVQEREYHREKAEQFKVISTAQNLIPELIFNGAPGAIDGLPVVSKEGIVLGGNGRTQAIQLHYAQGGQVPRDYLLNHSAQFGFTRDQIAQTHSPVVVRVVDLPDQGAPEFRRQAQELVRLLNVPLTQALSAKAEAVAESRRLTDETLEVLSVALADPETTLADYLSSRASRPFFAALERAGIVTVRTTDRLWSGDGFTEEGRRFVERLLTAAVLPDPALLDQLGPGTVGTLAAAAPWILSAAANGVAWDLREPLRKAARDLADLRSRDGTSVDSFLRQSGMFGKPHSLGDSAAEKLLHQLFALSNKPNKLRTAIRRFASIAAQNATNQAALFASEQISPSEALTMVSVTA